jgi:hypothetical protein
MSFQHELDSEKELLNYMSAQIGVEKTPEDILVCPCLRARAFV